MDRLNRELHDLIKNKFHLSSVQLMPIANGLNQVHSFFSTDGKQILVKTNEVKKFPEMLKKEADGLHLLKKANGLKLPTIIDAGVEGTMQYLFMEYIAEGNTSPEFWLNFGTGLAAQHQSTNPHFGLDYNNYIGTLIQLNNNHTTWENFLITERFIPQIKLAVDAEIISTNEAKKIEQIFNHITNLWPNEPPALLHGDLWAGNFIAAKTNNSSIAEPYVIDPAVYYGHREMDIGMMFLFGGFDNALFIAYNDIYALENGWENRIQYNQLYPLLVHLNLFGKTYFAEIQQIVNPFL